METATPESVPKLGHNCGRRLRQRSRSNLHRGKLTEYQELQPLFSLVVMILPFQDFLIAHAAVVTRVLVASPSEAS